MKTKIKIKKGFGKSEGGYMHFPFFVIAYGRNGFGVWLFGISLTVAFEGE